MSPRKTRRLAAVILAVAVCALSSGCLSGVRAYQVTDEDPDSKGIRYFLPALYLVVTEVGPERWTARIERGVDRTREFTVQPYNYMANNSAELDFEADGTLKSFVLVQDNTEIPQAMVTALRDLGLHQLELEERAVQREIEGAAAALVDGADAGTRRARIFQIQGDRLLPASANAELGFVSAAALIDLPPPVERPMPTSLGTGPLILPPEDGPISSDELAQLKFFGRDGRPIAAPEADELKAAASIEGGSIRLERATVERHHVRTVVLGIRSWNVE